MSIPHILSNPAEKYITEESAHSIFCIRSVPRGMKLHPDKARDKEAQKAYTELITRIISNDVKRNVDTWSSLDKVCTNGTGFAFEKPKNGLLTILTAAHLIKDAFCEHYCLDNTYLTQLNKSYIFEVKCIHLGREFQANGEGADEVDDANYLPATVVGIDSELDLLALQIDHVQLSSLCKENHATICGIAELPPPQGEKILLQAWPAKKPDTSVWGKVSSIRGFKWLTANNPHGYKMDVTEVPELNVEAGCSGGPLVDGRLKCVGVLHGTLDYCGYAVGVSNIRKILLSSGLMANSQNYAADATAGTERRQKDNNDGESTRRKRARKMKVPEEQEDDDDDNDDAKQEAKDDDADWTTKKDGKQRGRKRGGRGGRQGQRVEPRSRC